MPTQTNTPIEFQKIIDELSENPTLKFKDYDLKQKGIEPSQIRRWFLKNQRASHNNWKS